MCIGTAPQTTLLNKFSNTRILAKMALIHKEMISAKCLWGNVFLGGKLQMDAKNSNSDNFESALYMKSVSMPLTFPSFEKDYSFATG